MKVTKLIFAATLIASSATVIAGCGNGTTDEDDGNDTTLTADDLVGLWQTRVQSESPDCGNYDPLPVPVPFFSFEQVGETIEMYVCRSETDCDDFAEAGRTFTRDGNDWINIETWTFWNGDQSNDGICSNNARRTELKLRGGSILRVQVTQVQDATSDPQFTDETVCESRLDNWSPSFGVEPFNCERIDLEKPGGSDTDAAE